MDLVGKRRWFFLLSAIIILPGLISLLIPPRLYLGIEFTGGSTLSIDFAAPVSKTLVQTQLAKLGHPEAVVQGTGETGFFIRISRLREAEEGTTSEREDIQKAFEETIAPVARLDVSSVSGVVAEDTVRNAFIAVLVASIAIMLYITWAFRRIPRPFRYGVAAVIAIVHDVLIVVCIFSIFG